MRRIVLHHALASTGQRHVEVARHHAGYSNRAGYSTTGQAQADSIRHITELAGQAR